tara:strand:+ start:7944 stop:8609 length:666 start_codon:yes stop_codon:yes gene_type:complete
MKIESIHVGKPKAFQGDILSSIEKSLVQGSIRLNHENLVGDQQSDLTVHGGVDKAVYAYPQQHYAYWQQRVGLFRRQRIALPENPQGALGENLCLSGCDEKNILIGDTFQCGTVILQVTQPRQPCWKLGHKFQQKKLPQWMLMTGYTGWYLRVLEEGEIAAGMSLEKIASGCSQWTVSRCNDLFYARGLRRADLESILQCDTLSKVWHDDFSNRLAYLNKK